MGKPRGGAIHSGCTASLKNTEGLLGFGEESSSVGKVCEGWDEPQKPGALPRTSVKPVGRQTWCLSPQTKQKYWTMINIAPVTTLTFWKPPGKWNTVDFFIFHLESKILLTPTGDIIQIDLFSHRGGREANEPITSGGGKESHLRY